MAYRQKIGVPILGGTHGIGSAADLSIRRLRLELKELSRQLGVPDSLLRAYQKARLVHEMKRGELRADLGWCSEELAAFTVLSHCHAVHGMPLEGMDNLTLQLVQKQCTTFEPDIVWLVLRDSGKGWQGAILTGDRVQVEASEAPTYIFDLTALRKAFDVMLEEGTLKFPRAIEAVVSAVDPRVRSLPES